ncbi:restriction endonuclease subunit S [Flavobacterium sp. TMP13]|uniref:restriction endonuclease subunit S n=1 Tax=Flavobacterium sp. TMP13 TaxID=3425950 RepID=UPI003D773F7C
MENRQPNLRFPEFSGEWEVEKVGALCDSIVPGRNKPTNFEGNIPWITTPDIEHNGFITYSKKDLNISREEAKKVGSKIVPINSIIISCVGELGLSAITGKEIIINQQLHAFIPKEKIEYRFLLYELNLKKKYMDTVATKTAVPYMNKENCNSIPINFPTLPEQTKIANFLTEVDKKLTALKQKKSLLEQYKKGVMQQIFSQELRFKDDNGNDFADWEEKMLGDCLDYVQPIKYLVSSTEYDNSYKTPVLTAGKTFILGYTNETVGIFNENLPVIIFDDFTTATQFVDFSFKAKSSAMKILKSKEGFNIKFMYETMQIMKYELGGHERHWISKFAPFYILIPSFKEQTKIANFLSAMDEKINHCQGQIEKTQVWKKGLLQQLFV